KQIEETTSDYDREKLQERLAKLVGGVAVIKVGAATESEMKEKKARVEDALHATRAAVEEGIVPGGGVALLRAQSVLGELEPKLDEEQRAGLNIVRRAVEEPLRMISQNAGIDGSIVIEKVKNGKGAFGFNAATEEYEDLVKAGVIDPTKVVRSALQNAASVASLLLTTEAMIAEKPKEEHSHGGPGGPGRRGLPAFRARRAALRTPRARLKACREPAESATGRSRVAQAEELRRQQILQRRFQAMGLEAGLLAGGRSVLVTLPVG